MNCWNCNSAFETYKRIPQDPAGNYCPYCNTYLKSDKQIHMETQSVLKNLPEPVRNRLLNVTEDLLAPLSRLITIQQEIKRLPDTEGLQIIRESIETGQANLSTAYTNLTTLSGVQE